jgi:hypothetical protein
MSQSIVFVDARVADDPTRFGSLAPARDWVGQGVDRCGVAQMVRVLASGCELDSVQAHFGR